MGQNAKARNVPIQEMEEYSVEEKDSIYAIFNANTEGADGVSSADFFAVMLKIGEKVRELNGQ